MSSEIAALSVSQPPTERTPLKPHRRPSFAGHIVIQKGVGPLPHEPLSAEPLSPVIDLTDITLPSEDLKKDVPFSPIITSTPSSASTPGAAFDFKQKESLAKTRCCASCVIS
jgi:hypothetical protein